MLVMLHRARGKKVPKTVKKLWNPGKKSLTFGVFLLYNSQAPVKGALR